MTDEDALYARLNEQPKFRRLAPSTLRAAWWAATALRRARRDLRTGGLAATVQPPPALPWGARTGVLGVLARTSPTCLERAVVLQSWLHLHGVECDVVVGVASEEGTIKAHAWVDGITPAHEYEKYRVIHRIPSQAGAA